MGPRRPLALLCLILGVATGTGPASVGAGHHPGTGASAGAQADPPLWLRGPFGTVPGVPLGAPGARLGAPAPSPRPVLDAYVRGAPLRLDTGDPDVLFRAWRITTAGLDGTGEHVEADGVADDGTASSGVPFAGPDVPGVYALEARVELTDGTAAAAAWTLSVPDREVPADGLIDVPAPRLLLTSASGTVSGWAGSGCHIYLCVDVGRLPPLRMVPRLEVRQDEPLAFRLSDGSAIAAWKATLYPIVSGVQPSVAELGETPAAPIATFTVPAPAAGTWLLQAEVTYDRLRGWTHTFYRLGSRAAGPPDRGSAPTGRPTPRPEAGVVSLPPPR